jgi:antibiotic biosynthesis monooxygenase (ABM) superfamily enzyme
LDSAVILVVYLFVRPERETAFREFKIEAARVMRGYGGRIDRVIRPIVPAGGAPLPHEIHIVSFPSMERFEAYREDRRLAELAPLRRSAIARTEVTIGEEGTSYA